MRTLILMSILVAALLVAGCNDDDPAEPTNRPPVACFSMSATPHPDRLDSVIICPYNFDFMLDPTCTWDDETRTSDLEIRWDFDNDGVWDTEFGDLVVTRSSDPDPAATVWSARLQVRDQEGLTASIAEEIPVGPFPTAPDIIAGRICLEPGYSPDFCEDTVAAGEEFGIMIYATYFGPSGTGSSREVVTLNGEILRQSVNNVWGELFDCNGGGGGPYQIDEPGEYDLVLYLDYDNEIAETDETNNTYTMTVTVTP
jgi:hypothetical protein